MASDNDYDRFDYNSSQDSFEIDYQIDLFEFRQYFKSKKTKQRIKKSSCPLSVKTLKSQSTLVKINCMGYKKTSKAERKSFRYDHYPQNKQIIFECDKQYQNKSTHTSKVLEDEHLEDFSKFRHHFYCINHEQIKSSLQDYPNIEIKDIRSAPVHETVQNDFMKKLNENTSYFPHLVYHGTKLKNIQSILHYGFLIPNRVHPTNSEAPIIVSEHGRAYGTGVYCSRTAIYSLSYVSTTNTLLVCAAIPKRNKVGKVERCHRNILVLSDVSRIIPLFLVDFKYLNPSSMNQPLFNEQKEIKIDENKEIKKPVEISRKYLRKILSFMNDQLRKNDQYQLRIQFQSYYFNFSYFCKRYFDILCQQHLPYITNQIITLNLCDGEKTPEQINLFFSYIPSISHFTHLRSLTLSGLRSYKILMRIVEEIHHLHNLTHLYFNSCSCQSTSIDFQLIVNNIWSLPILIHCEFDIHIYGHKFFCLPTKLSRSLKTVYISKQEFKWNQIYQLYEYTPCLKHLSISIEYYENEDLCKSFSIPTLIDLKINACYISDISNIISFLKNLSNLRRLDIHLKTILISGYQWEQIIHNYLPKLKVFQLFMSYLLPTSQNIEERVDELINSFQSSFWIDEHKWFVRCLIYYQTLKLQTLSNIFHHSEEKLLDIWKSTYPYDDHQNFCNTIKTIFHPTIFKQPIPSYSQLYNISNLSIKLPFSDEFWFVIPHLKKLFSLTVFSHHDNFQSQLQTLLDRAPYLHSLSIRQDESLPLQMSLFKYIKPSIRRVYLWNYNYRFNEEECFILSQSPLGIQCEILFIEVKNCKSVIVLVQNMINLRALHVQFEYEKDSSHISSITNDNESYDVYTLNRDEIIQWLKDHLPSTCSIGKGSDLVSRIRIWI